MCKYILTSQDYSKILKTTQNNGWGNFLPVFALKLIYVIESW